MSVWLTIPSARPPEQAEPILKLWRERGYQVAVWREAESRSVIDSCTIEFRGPTYPGYAVAVNTLIRRVMECDRDAEWFIAGGDDTQPDPDHSAEEIAQECSEYFALPRVYPGPLQSTFGVMQPTGDRWHEGVGGFANAPIDRVCGSAWYGREYCRRMYQGQGPLFAGYKHMFVDEEAQLVAEKMGVFWQRRDLTQKHCHWGRGATDKASVTAPKTSAEWAARGAAHLEKWNTAAHWQESKALFQNRQAAGFPGHEPIP